MMEPSAPSMVPQRLHRSEQEEGPTMKCTSRESGVGYCPTKNRVVLHPQPLCKS